MTWDKENEYNFMIDPPSGWKYGFPRRYNHHVDGPMREFLLKHGYPEEDVEFALKHIRMWHCEEK